MELGAQVKQEIAANPQDYPVLNENTYPEAYNHIYRIRDSILNTGEIYYDDQFVWEVNIIQNDSVLNAFAVPGGYMYFYTGLIKYLDNEAQFAGVMAHEMSHIKNNDILIATVTIGVVGAIALISEILFYSLFWGGAGRGRKGEGNAILMVVAILLVILAPIFARLTYLAISRKREYLADSNGAYLTRNPNGLAQALTKIKEDHPRGKPKGSKTVAPLYISNPFKSTSVSSIWSTHPPIDERISRLRSM